MPLLSLAAACAALLAPSDPPQEAHIDASTTFVVHLDYRHAVATELGRYLLDHMADQQDADFLDEFTTDLDIEFGDDIRGMTVYGSGASLGAGAGDGNVGIQAERGERTVLLVYGSDALQQWDDALAREEADPAPARLADHPVREINRGDEHWLGVMLPLQEDGRLWVFAPKLDMLEGALAVIDGRAEQVDLDAWSVAGPETGSFLYVAVRDFDAFEEWAPVSDVGKHTKGFSLSLGQNDRDGFARLQITAPGDEDAEAIVGICQGVIGLARLTLRESEQLKPLLKFVGKIRLASEGRVIDVSLVQDADTMHQLLLELESPEQPEPPEEAESPDQ